MDFVGTYEEEDTCVDAMLFSTNQIFHTVLSAAVQLDLFGIIAKEGPGAYVSATDIACKLPTKNPEAPSRIDRMLRLFASHSLLSCSLRSLEDGRVQRVYGLTPVSTFFINGSKDEGSLFPFINYSNQLASLNVRLNFKDSILEGGDLFKKVHGISMFEYMQKNPEFNSMYNEAMASVSTINMNAILEVYKGFEGLTSLVDVAGGTGKSLHMIISKYPSIKGINFDLPHVIQTAPQYPGIQHVAGNMLSSVPKGDAIMIKATCHSLNDEDVLKILRNIYKELPIGGKLIIMELVLPEEPNTSKISQLVSRFDARMLAHNVGKERTIQEFKALTEAAGFTNFQVSCVGHAITAVMESYK